jgi:hypothetical protein
MKLLAVVLLAVSTFAQTTTHRSHAPSRVSFRVSSGQTQTLDFSDLKRSALVTFEFESDSDVEVTGYGPLHETAMLLAEPDRPARDTLFQRSGTHFDVSFTATPGSRIEVKDERTKGDIVSGLVAALNGRSEETTRAIKSNQVRIKITVIN